MDISFAQLLKILCFTISYFLCTIADDNYYGFCGDPTCSEPVGEGLTMQRYNAPDRSRISFEANERFEIFVKNAGQKKDLLGILINGKKGYVPTILVKEVKALVSSSLLVPAQADFVLRDVNTNNVVSQVQSSSQWSHQNAQPLMSHTDSRFQEMGQDSSQWSHQNAQPLMSHTDSRFQEMGQDSSQWSNQDAQSFMSHGDSNFQAMGQGSSEWSNQEVQFFMPHSDGNFPSREQNYHTDYDYLYSENTGPGQSPQYHAPQSIYSSSGETYSNYDYHTESPHLEPSVKVHVQSNIVIPTSHKTHIEYLAGSQGNTPEQQHQFVTDSARQDSQWLESSFSSQWQDNSHYSQNLHSNEEHASNFDYEVKSATIPSQVSEQETSAKSFDSQINSKQFVGESNQFQSLTTDSHRNAHNQDLLDTIAMLKKQGYDVSADMDQLLYDQNSQENLNPSQHVHFTQGTSGASYGHSSSSFFENPDERVSETHTSSENLISSFPSSGDQKMTETSKPLLDHQGTSILDNQNIEETTKSVKDTTVEESPEEGDFDEDDEDMDDDEIDVEEEEETVLDLTPSKDQEVENQNETVFSDSDLQQKGNVTLTQSDIEITELNSHFVNSVSPPDVQSTHVQETSLKHDSSDDSIHKSDFVPSLDDKETLNQVKIAKENVSPDTDLKNFEERNIKDNIIDDSVLGDTPLTQSNSLVTKTEADYSESSKYPQVSNNSMSESTDVINENVIGMLPDADQYTKESELSKIGVFPFDKTDGTLITESVNETDILPDREQETELDKILNISELSESEKVGYFNPYQIRNLKEENDAKDSQNVDPDEETEDNGTYIEFDFYGSMENSLEAIRSFIELLLSWVPEPLYSIIMDVQKRGISPRVPVFTIISSIPCISLIIAIVFIREKSKEKKLTTLLALSEKNVYMLTAEKNILEEKIEKTAEELKSSSSTLDTERSTYESLRSEVTSLKQEIQKTSQELESSMEEIDVMKEREKEYVELVNDHEKAHLDLREEKTQVENKVLELEEAMSSLNSEIIEKDNELDELQKEKLEFLQSSKDYEEKLSQLQQNCNQLLKEAEVWNMRVNELTSKLSEVSSAKDELESTLKLKDGEIESLTHLVQNLKSYEELEFTDSDEIKSNEEKLKDLLNSTNILIKLQNQEEENKVLVEKLSREKNKILEMEVELLEAKSESDKLKLSYNQALQDKAEAQTKLDVLTNYFKDKEIQMQKQIGAQEAVREKREKDADSAERRICLIEQENASYKYQVASMKQEMEETERNLKSQIATQEKKAHENWIAARAAERKLEDMKQEVTQLRQRLTLLEREQENWANSSRDEIIRPVPKRISGINDESATSQDMNNSMDLRHNIFPPPPPHPMMLPLDRPLPPLPPPHHLPPFLPPPPLEPQFRMQPWLLPPHGDSMSGSDYRITPPDFGRGRELTPPRGRHSAVVDGDMVPMQSSPLGAEMRDSRNSTPPHSLPDFHDIPPPPRPYFPPPGTHPRYPLPPPFRRDLNQGPRKTENPSDHSSSGHGTQQSSVLQDNWPHSNSRV